MVQALVQPLSPKLLAIFKNMASELCTGEQRGANRWGPQLHVPAGSTGAPSLLTHAARPQSECSSWVDPDSRTSCSQRGPQGKNKSSMRPAATASSPPTGLDSMPAACKKLVPMNLFGAWEVDCSIPTWVPELCSLTLTKLLIRKELAKELTSLVIAVRSKNSKFVLRSDEIVMPPRRPVKTDLKLTFSLQYPHSIKREGNKLQIMLQKKLRLENQTILGYQTLAMGTIDMAEVIQRAPEAGQVLSLYSTIREASTHVAEVTISSLSSQSIDLIHSTQEAKSRVHYSEIEYETISELQASHDPRHRQDQDEEDFKVEEPKKQHEERVSSPFMTRQQDANKKVGAWLRQVQMWKKDLDLEEASLENVPEVEKDIDNLYDSLEKFNDSGP
ncbi:phosphofurin acidic cluster sorting protein 2-like isoform X2 [Eptesicus fuscus]|uniref:phosphofurin acidic cluster sorting protein 2-like isoform X2 n=1 Tax=Eptesicus fuscus TaxID=29078 RepID=UPI002403F551|nr:phosphofurin acidic cluster sorting protein 2-like isoform X2 [Eptesicus fuscus]